MFLNIQFFSSYHNDKPEDQKKKHKQIPKIDICTSVVY